MFQKLATEILTDPKTFPGKFHPIKCDVMQEQDIKDAFESIRTNIGEIAILVNNAGVLGPYKELTGEYMKSYTTLK